MIEKSTYFNKVGSVALSFGDVTLVPGHSKAAKHDACVKTNLTSKLALNIPIISAAMDTVTEAKLAIALARQGGIGIIHCNLSIADQAIEVQRVKRAEAFVISDPLTVKPGDTLAEVLKLMESGVSGLPVVDDANHLVGIVTKRDLPMSGDDTQLVSSFMTSNVFTANVGVTLEQAEIILHNNRCEKLPVIDGEGILRGLITKRDIESLKDNPNAVKDSQGRLLVGAAVKVADWETRVPALLSAGVDVIVVDSSHGDSKAVLETIRGIRAISDEIQIIGGNVVTAEGTIALIEAGVNAVKVGIGPGSICTTRVVTGGGIPQLSAIMECYDVAKKSGIPIIADGGITTSGDIAKALAAGASVVMLGNLLARTEEAPGDVIVDASGGRWRFYRGMGSIPAIKAGSGSRYFQEGSIDEKNIIPEGIEARVPCLGLLKEITYQLVGGLRAGMGLTGCTTIDELHQKATFRRITPAGLREGDVHDVIPIDLPINYKIGR